MNVGEHYRDARVRIGELLAGLPAEAHLAPVPACPGWRVRDVVAHLAGIVEDGLAGRISGLPTQRQITEQVDRSSALPLDAVLEGWARTAPAFERLISENSMWPAVVDVVSHEHDIRGAVDQPGARDIDTVRVVSEFLLRFRTPVPLTIDVEDTSIQLGDGTPDALRLSTGRWEAIRWRTGRRSRAQLAAMAWTGDPAPVLDHLYLFGPAAADITE